LDQLENVVLTEGHLQRPGGFQWREGIRVSDVIPSISALLPNPDLQYALVVRQQPQTRMSIVHKLQLGSAISNPGSAADLELQPNDRIVTFGSTVDREENLSDLLDELNAQANFGNPAAIVSAQGNVRFPGEYPYLEGMSVGDIVNSAGGMLENSDNKYALLIRNRDNQGAITVEEAIADSLSINSTKSVSRGDALLIFAANASRDELLGEVVAQLKYQSDSIERSRIVRASGQVRFPGEYPLYEGMTVEGLVRAAGGYTESALTTEAELARYFVQAGIGRQIDIVDVNLQSSGALGQKLRLAEFDNLVVRQLPNWTESESITISGEVISPGTYSIAKGDSLSSVLRRAGGLTAYADPNASVLLRATLREQERELLAQYQDELLSDMVAVALEEEGEDQAEALSVGENLLAQVKNVEPLGRLVIDLPNLLAGATEEDVIIRNGDQLYLPRTRQEVSILGEVNYPTSHLFNPGLSVGDYIDLSGGLTQRSDASRTYIIKANGQVVSYSSSRWFFQKEGALEAGDTIVVPFDVEPTNYLVTWTSVSTILFNLATSVLAIQSVSD
jgi:polysaccharide export outer membrane protein